MIYIGIDPGLHGAVGTLIEEPEIETYDMDGSAGRRPTGKTILTPHVFDTPTVEVDGKFKYLVGGMALLLKPFANRSNVLAILEDVHSMPKQGVASSFNFGVGKGVWLGILGAYEIPFELVSPQRWKKFMSLDKDKNAARLKASQMFPSIAEQFKLVKYDGRAEAILMAEYGKRLYTK